MEVTNYKCSKCSDGEYETGQLRATGGILAKLFNIQNKRFYTVSCKQCGYTDMYKRVRGRGGTVENVADALVGNWL